MQDEAKKEKMRQYYRDRRAKQRARIDAERAAAGPRICDWCGSEFKPHRKKWNTQRFCSAKCRKDAGNDGAKTRTTNNDPSKVTWGNYRGMDVKPKDTYVLSFFNKVHFFFEP